MDKKDYQQKVHLMLSDSSIYNILDEDPTLKLTKLCKKHIKQLFDQKRIDNRVRDYLPDNNPLPQKFYGLPKIHKSGLPLRPVVSFIKSPLYALSQFIATILRNIKNKTFNVRSSIHVKKLLENVTLDPNDEFVSFDAISIYTNISNTLAVNTTLSRWDDIEPHCAIDKVSFFENLELCLNNN